MARRQVTSRVNCAKPGCREVAHFEYDSQRERAEAERRRRDAPWRCTRHTNEEQVLSGDNTERTVTLTAVRRRNPSYERELAEYEAAIARRSNFAREPSEFYDGLTWAGHHSALVTGPGFKAFANDFPEGTRLVVNIRVETPEDPDGPA